MAYSWVLLSLRAKLSNFCSMRAAAASEGNCGTTEDLTITKSTITIDSINYDGKVVKSAVVYPK